MTFYDRALVAVIHWLIRRLRSDQGRGRVFWWNVETFKPQRLRSGAYTPKGASFTLGFGADEESAKGNLAELFMTRQMAELLRDNLITGLQLQDDQYAIVEEA